MRDVAVNHHSVERVATTWPMRATVRCGTLHQELAVDSWDPLAPDYPVALLPFAEHPTFIRATPEQQRHILTLAWLVYNERVITAEDRVANPAFGLVQRGVFPGADSPAFQEAVQQTLIDEHWHSYMHRVVMRRTTERRGLDASSLTFPPSVTYRALVREQAAATERWERDLLTLVWTVVSEISINALLSLLARDATIQPLHRTVTAMHAKDEDFHGAVMVEVTKALWLKMTTQQRDRFIEAFPKALGAFAAQDYSAWEVIVDHVGLVGGRKMLAECAASGGNSRLVRDYRGLDYLAATLGIRDQISFDFPDPSPDLDGGSYDLT